MDYACSRSKSTVRIVDQGQSLVARESGSQRARKSMRCARPRSPSTGDYCTASCIRFAQGDLGEDAGRVVGDKASLDATSFLRAQEVNSGS